MRNIKLTEDVVSLKEFRARASHWLKHVAKNRRPLLITQNGKPAGVLMYPRDFDESQEKVRFVEAVATGLEDVEAGRFVSEKARQNAEKGVREAREMKIRWTGRAANDLAEIVRYIAGDNPAAALRAAEKITPKVKGLSAHPKSGRVVPEFGQISIRELIVGNYRVVYCLGGKTVDVLTVFEGHRLMPIEDKDISEH